MLKNDMTRYCTAAALAVRTFVTGSSNLNSYGQGIRDIGTALGLRLTDLDNIRRTRGSWLGTMVDFLGVERVTAIYQLIANHDQKPAAWGAAPNQAQNSALQIQQKADVYNTFKRFANLWAANVQHPTWQQESGALGTNNAQTYESLAVKAASNATGNCGETSLLAYLLLVTLPKDGKFQAAYTAASDLTVGWYGGTHFDHAYVIVSNHGFNADQGSADSFCICDAWLGTSFPALVADLHYDAPNVHNVAQNAPGSMPEMKVGTYKFASTSDALVKIQGVMQILHSSFLDQLAAAH